ncbi:MAG TPA: hypothetical protein VM689_08450 [Aliidongia sp.]|nr:hypothetical protein [Aliidongia sp.]
MLAPAAFDRAVAFIRDRGRSLDVELLKHTFTGDNAPAVLAALAAYQNPDGGFGRALEPDIRSPASSAIASSIGFNVLRRVDAGPDEPLVRRGVAWLVEHCRDGVWPIVDAAIDHAPHAFWWNWSEDLAKAWNGFRFNPTAELLGYLFDHRALVPQALLARVQDGLLGNLEAQPILTGAYDLKAALRLAETQDLPALLWHRLASVLRASAPRLDDPHATALELVPKPGSLLHAVLADRVEADIERLIAAQQPDGSWAPFWDWRAVSPNAWVEAERDWRSVLTRQALELLHAHGRIGL